MLASHMHWLDEMFSVPQGQEGESQYVTMFALALRLIIQQMFDMIINMLCGLCVRAFSTIYQVPVVNSIQQINQHNLCLTFIYFLSHSSLLIQRQNVGILDSIGRTPVSEAFHADGWSRWHRFEPNT